jgi:lipopolysaccharide/colanic/teichoic acid biosynthesis glycosyltransferase
MQRVVDLVLSIVLLAVVMPLVVGCVLVVLLTAGRPAIFSQRRIGRGGQPFALYKIRSMTNAAAGAAGPAITASGDARVSGSGRFLRRFKLDELPQLCNVLQGDLSLVGLRPEVFDFEDIVRRDAYAPLLARRPGIVSRRTLESYDEEQLLAGELAARAVKGETTTVDALYREWLLPTKLAREVEDIARYTPIVSEIALGVRTMLRMVGLASSLPRRGRAGVGGSQTDASCDGTGA